MAVTGGDLDSKIPKMPITFNARVESELNMQSRSWNATDSNKTIFHLIMTVLRNVPRYSMGFSHILTAYKIVGHFFGLSYREISGHNQVENSFF